MSIKCKKIDNEFKRLNNIDFLYNLKICRFCKRTDVPLMKQMRKGARQYYSCRECNTERLKQYRITEKGAFNARMAVYRSIKKYPEKQIAREKLNSAVKQGKIIKPKRCDICGERRRVEGHHGDYSKPLSVLWVCRQCHNMVK